MIISLKLVMRFIIPFVLFYSSLILKGQNFDWAQKYIKYENLGGTSVVHDNQGNVYVVGGWTSDPKSHDYHEGSFISKYATDGSIIWHHDLRYGNVNITMSSSDVILLSGYDSTSYFVAQYDTSGFLLSKLDLFSRTEGVVSDIGCDVNNNIYILGMFWDTLNILSQSIVKEYSSNLFLVKINSSNTITWAQTSTSGNFAGGACLEVDANGSCYVGGQFTGTFSVGGETLQSKIYDAYIIKYNSNGVFQWKIGFSGAGQEYISAISANSVGQVYATGYYDSPLPIGNNTLAAAAMPYPDGFIVKISSNGGILWSKRLASGGPDYITDITVSPTQNIYVCGSYFKSSGVQSFTIDNQVLNSNSDVKQEPVIAKFDSSGILSWLVNTGTHAFSVGSANALTVDQNHRLFVTGTIDSVMSFGKEIRTEYPTMFLTRISDNESTGLNTVSEQQKDLKINVYPIPVSSVLSVKSLIENYKGFEVSLLNLNGSELLRERSTSDEHRIDVSRFEPGAYILVVQKNDRKIYRKIIIN